MSVYLARQQTFWCIQISFMVCRSISLKNAGSGYTHWFIMVGFCHFLLKMYPSCFSQAHVACEVGNTRKPVPSGGSGMTIAQEAARNVDPATGPKTAEEEEKQRKRLETWKKMQEQDKDEEKDKVGSSFRQRHCTQIEIAFDWSAWEASTHQDRYPHCFSVPSHSFPCKKVYGCVFVGSGVSDMKDVEESEIESKLNKLSSARKNEEEDKKHKMDQVRAALKEVNQRNRDLGPGHRLDTGSW